LTNELEQRVIRQVLECEFTLSSVARIRLPQYGMPITRNDLASLQCRPHIFFHSPIGCILTNLGLHLAQPEENFLVGETVKRTGEAIQRCTEGKEWVREGRSDKFTGVGRNVATLVVTMIVNEQTLNNLII